METGIKLKEARTAAGLSQAALADASGVVTASDISKAERGIKELTPEQLEALAAVLGVAPESLTGAEPADAPDEPPVSDQELLALFRAADADKQTMVVSALKGAQVNPELASLLAGILKNNEPGALLNAVKTIILGANVGDLLGFVKYFMGSISGSGKAGAAKSGSAGSSAAESCGGQNGNEISVPLLAFTYFYSATFYILLLSFYFWSWNKDIKPEK